MIDVRAKSADELDFLPARYRQQHTGRRTTARCMIAAGGCALVLIVSYSVQRHQRSRLQDEQDLVATHHQIAVTQTKQLAQLQARTADLTDQAQMYTYLRHPWPRTAMLDAIARSAPDSVVLTEIKVSRTPQKVGRTTAQRSPAAPSDPLEGIAADLQQLRKEFDNTRVLVTVEGITYDATEFHSLFMGRLRQARLFPASKLLSIREDKSLPSGASRFRVELTTKPGYGQTHGPQGDLASMEMTRLGDWGAERPSMREPTAMRSSSSVRIGGGKTWNK